MSDSTRKDRPARYVATMATPGYLPWSDDIPTFGTTADAWQYLRDERKRQEDDATAIDETGPDELPWSGTVDELTLMTTGIHAIGTVHGDTPGYDGDHDLGVAYTVDVATDEDMAAGCEGHPAGPYDPMGVTVYCDGSCAF